VGGAMEISIAV